MPYAFTDSSSYAYTRGARSTLFLGACPETGQEVGIETERHAITIAGARSGKGAALIHQNLVRWPHAVLCIDPKGENAAQTWQARQAMGQTVAVLDPFGVSKVPDAVRATFNPLEAIQPYAPRARERVEALADGMVVVHDPKHMEWVEGARSIIAGVIAFAMAMAPPDKRNLAFVRQLLMQQPNVPQKGQPTPDSGLYAMAQSMLACNACGGLAQDAGNTILQALESDRGMPPAFLEGAKRGTRWLDSPEIGASLSGSSFDLSGLKNDSLSLYLVLQPDEIRSYSAFFRLFVKAALKVMMTDEPEQDHRCLFILDEFYSLGKVGTIAEAAGLMAGYGVTLWPFLQDLGQLRELYADNGAETFFGNADAEIYFNNKDAKTLNRISEQLEKTKPDEVETGPPEQAAFVETPFPEVRWKFWISEKRARELHDVEQRNLREKHRIKHGYTQSKYDHKMRNAGAARLTPSEVAALIGKGNNEKIARSAIVFAKAGDVLNVILWPYFVDDNPAKEISSERRVMRYFADWDARRALQKDEHPYVTLFRNISEYVDAEQKTIKWFIYFFQWFLFAILTLIYAKFIGNLTIGGLLLGGFLNYGVWIIGAIIMNDKFDDWAMVSRAERIYPETKRITKS